MPGGTLRPARCERGRQAARARQRRRRACRGRLRQRGCCLVTHWSPALAPFPGAKRADSGACGRVWQALQELRGRHCRYCAVTRSDTRTRSQGARLARHLRGANRAVRLQGGYAPSRSPHGSYRGLNKAATGALGCNGV